MQQRHGVERPRALNLKAYIRAWVAMTLIVVWSLAAFSGFLLWLAPSGPRSGWQVLFLGLTKRQWGTYTFGSASPPSGSRSPM